VTASTRSGFATTLSGSLTPGKYFTFSCSWLMMSVNFLPSIISSYTHICHRTQSKQGTQSTSGATDTPCQEHIPTCTVVSTRGMRAAGRAQAADVAAVVVAVVTGTDEGVSAQSQTDDQQRHAHNTTMHRQHRKKPPSPREEGKTRHAASGSTTAGVLEVAMAAHTTHHARARIHASSEVPRSPRHTLIHTNHP